MKRVLFVVYKVVYKFIICYFCGTVTVIRAHKGGGSVLEGVINLGSGVRGLLEGVSNSSSIMLEGVSN
ncbi:hypothetical protein CWI38_2420p0030 [Hamiltosporidium tvaerminnensis]|uniref:Uncharacterized protein n=1 Tax=Hamiltosporidium tvaerminnensis TaxID=1176355 RepID=A0A4V2JWA7_9MICR|nr:hypothetical protein CWI38_2420p0030 [Hamiltosporidium tvaerminnensis]